MAKIIKTADPAVKTFEKGQTVEWITRFHDGRSYENKVHSGIVVKVCRVNLHVQCPKGHIWEVNKNEIKLI